MDIKNILLDFSLTVKAATLIFISGRGSAISSAKEGKSGFIYNSNTPRLYSQWLNSVIYWLINHCTDRARTGVTSSGRQFEFS